MILCVLSLGVMKFINFVIAILLSPVVIALLEMSLCIVTLVDSVLDILLSFRLISHDISPKIIMIYFTLSINSKIMYYTYVINNARRTVTIRQFDDNGDRIATYRTYPFSSCEWEGIRDAIMNPDYTQEILKSLVHGSMCRKIR